MKIHDCEQGSTAWNLLRCGLPTASQFDQLVTHTGKVRTGEMPKTYVEKKIAEKVMGLPRDGVFTRAMDDGAILEAEALPWFEFVTGIKPQRVGFCTTDDGLVGCSPDALIGDDSGLEIKCPEPHTHVRYLLGDKVPPEYMAQVQGCMFVTGRPRWTFVSYSRHLPPLRVEVKADHEFHASLRIALDDFQSALSAGHAKVMAKLEIGRAA